MRVAVISDVHGNAFALEATLREVRSAAPDIIVNLGDQVEGSADPGRAAQLQAELGAVEVRGNNEEKLWPGGRRNPLSLQYGAWLATQLDKATVARLSALPLTARLDGGRVLACHGTPDSSWESLLWVWDRGPDGRGFYRSRDPRELLAAVAPLQAEVIVCGHTHRPGATRVGDTLIVNAGAVSDQVDGDPRARWTLLERRGAGWAVEFLAVAYDVQAAVSWARTHTPFGDFQAQLLGSGVMDGRGD
ncbi:metallophosphoesterase family protein [Deinococcus deserti]|uniref:Putative metallophosphoesterase n=1 Tax=Deinococcus deserti (strain DSM 17065 / CIP 109153 / LMG 22923 / VCD115) TaxID=546414 RepID=C1CWR8_DEIDV|nr:metallophosphoesterase family protein [Deinococcus deserti]ACO46635.1 putative metallophosphoesterase [Deinococcus deserti VCD115]